MMTVNTRESGEDQQRPQGPFRLLTVNTAPDRARRLVGRMCEVKHIYQIIHVANISSIDGVRPAVEEHRPDVLFTASMWSAEEAQRIINMAKELVPNLRTLSVPEGLQVEKGPDAVVEYIKGSLPKVLVQ